MFEAHENDPEHMADRIQNWLLMDGTDTVDTAQQSSASKGAREHDVLLDRVTKTILVMECTVLVRSVVARGAFT